MPKSKEMCSGCRDDFYNRNRSGGCWSFVTAKVVTRMKVGTFQPPPYIWTPQKCLSCFHQQGYSMIQRTDPRVVKDAKAAAKWREEVYGT